MTDTERNLIEELLAQEGQQPPEEEVPPQVEEAGLTDRVGELEKDLELLRRWGRYEMATMRREIRELQDELEAEHERRTAGIRFYIRRARTCGFLVGVGVAMVLLPLLTSMAGLSWRLLRWLAGLLDSSPELLACGIAVTLSGALLLWVAKPLGEFLTRTEEADDEDWDEEG